MIDPELLKVLVCPETQAPLRPAGAALLAQLNAAIAAGTLQNRAGRPLLEPLHAALLRDDQQVVYPILDDIPVLLVDEGIVIAQR